MSGAQRTLALDPGETTGWSVWDYSDREPLEHIAHGMLAGGLDAFVEVFPVLLKELLPTRVVAESFVLDGRTAFPNVTPLRIEGALAALWHGPIILQRNVYKRHAPDDLLKRLDLWWPGAGHDRDSARHAIAERFTAGHVPTLNWMFPKTDAE